MEDDFDLVVSDIRMPGIFGLTILEGTRQWDRFPPIILITAFGDEETHAHAARLLLRCLISRLRLMTYCLRYERLSAYLPLIPLSSYAGMLH